MFHEIRRKMGSCDSQKKTAPNPAVYPSVLGASDLDRVPLYSACRSLRALRSCFRPSTPRLCAALPLLLHGGAVRGPQADEAQEAGSGKRRTAQRRSDRERRESDGDPKDIAGGFFLWNARNPFPFWPRSKRKRVSKKRPLLPSTKENGFLHLVHSVPAAENLISSPRSEAFPPGTSAGSLPRPGAAAAGRRKSPTRCGVSGSSWGRGAGDCPDQ